MNIGLIKGSMKHSFKHFSVLFLTLPIACYLIGLLVLSNLSGQNINDIVIFDTSRDFSYVSNFLTLMVIIGGLTGAFLCPGLLWLNAFDKKRAVGLQGCVYAFLISLAMLEGIEFGLRALSPGDVTRLEFISAVIAVTVCGAWYILFFKKGRNASLRGFTLEEFSVFVVFIVCAGLLFISFTDKLFIEDVNEDGHMIIDSAFWLQQAIPYEELNEIAYLKPMIGMIFLNLFGKAVTSLRIPYFFILGLISMVALAIIYESKKIDSKEPCFIVLGHAMLFTVFMFFQPDWHPYHVDVIHVTSDMYFLLLSLCFIYTLITKRYGFVLLATALLFQCAHYAFVLTICILASYWIFFKKERRAVESLSVKVLIIGAIGVVLIIIHAWYFQYLDKWPEAIWWEWLCHIFTENVTISPFQFVVKYGLLVGGIPFAMLFFYWPQDRVVKCINLVSLVYFIILLLIKDKSLHLLMPIAFLPTISFLRWIYSSGKNRNRLYPVRIIHFIILILCFIALWPYQYQPAKHIQNFWSKVQIVFEKEFKKGQDIYYIDHYVEHAMEDVLTRNGLFHLSIGDMEIYSTISDVVSSDFDYYITDNLKLMPDNLTVLAHFERIYDYRLKGGDRNLDDSNLDSYAIHPEKYRLNQFHANLDDNYGFYFLCRNISDFQKLKAKYIMSVEERYIPNYIQIKKWAMKQFFNQFN